MTSASHSHHLAQIAACAWYLLGSSIDTREMRRKAMTHVLGSLLCGRLSRGGRLRQEGPLHVSYPQGPGANSKGLLVLR
jgi:hypothetical protein